MYNILCMGCCNMQPVNEIKPVRIWVKVSARRRFIKTVSRCQGCRAGVEVKQQQVGQHGA